MKIAIAFEIFYPVVNGIITSGRNLAENLVAQGHEVVFFAPDTGEFREPFISGIPVYYISSIRSNTYPGMRYVLPWNRRVLRIFERERFDVLHMTGPWFLTMACINAARRLGVPVIHTFHTMVHESDYLLYMVRLRLLVPAIREIGWIFYGWFLRRCKANTAPSRMACATLDRVFPGSDTRFISNGVDLERFERFASRGELQERYPWFSDHTVIYVGRMGQEKSVEDLLEAMALLPEEEGIQLVLVGEGPSEERFRRLARSRHLGNRARFLGRIPHEELLSSGVIHHARAFVTASTTENQPMTVIEAICCGIPAIVPDVAGIRELVDENGLLVAPHDPSALAGAIRTICTDEELHRRCSVATERQRRRFDGARVAKHFLELYREVVDGNDRSSAVPAHLASPGPANYTDRMKAVIFDLDGVVVYTDAYHYRGWKRLAEEEGWQFEESLNDQLRGVSRMASLQIILDHNGIDYPDEKKREMADRKNEYYREMLQDVDETALVAGALEFIREIRSRGIRTGLGSSSKNALTVLDSLGITDLFEAIVTGVDITRSKPDPEIFLLGAERLRLEPRECVVFEDAVSGVEAANAAGMISVGFGPTEGLAEANPDLLIPDYASLDVDAFVRGELFRRGD